MVAVPRLIRGADGAGTASELAVTNLAPTPGETQFAVLVFDRNGLVGHFCETLRERQTAYYDLRQWDFVDAGFVGSAVISATAWSHVVPDRAGDLHDVVALGAVAVERGTGGEGSTEAAAYATGDVGIPLPDAAAEEIAEDLAGMAPPCR